MSRKPKFKPEIRRVKLNPEQAVLTCTGHNNHMIIKGAAGGRVTFRLDAAGLHCMSPRLTAVARDSGSVTGVMVDLVGEPINS